MESFLIQVIEPKTMKLLESMEDLGLIKINREPDSLKEKDVSSKESKEHSAPSLGDITREAENIKDPRYSRKSE